MPERPVITIKSTDLKAEFDKASGGDGSIDFSEIGPIEEKFGLSMEISADMKYWKDMKITYADFVDMLKRNGNIAQEGGNVKLQVRRSELDSAFQEAGGADGIIDFNDIGKVEKKYGLPMNISGDMKYWQDLKITKDEFMEMLERNGNIIPEEEEAAPAPAQPATDAAAAPAGVAAAPAPSAAADAAPREAAGTLAAPAGAATAPAPAAATAAPAPAPDAAPGDAVAGEGGGGARERAKALFRKYEECDDDMIPLATLQQIVAKLGGAGWTEGRLAALLDGQTKGGKLHIGEFFDWCFA